MNLKNLAAELGVSPSTVSRVLNNYKNFSVMPELRERILTRARELGYDPNPVYQSMRQKSNKQISILLPHLLNLTEGAGIARGVDALSEYLAGHGFSFHYLSRPLEQCRTYGLPPWKVGGAVAVDVRHPGLVVELDNSGIPYVSLNGVAGPNGVAVLTDDRANMYLALNYLYELGHRRIGYVNHYRRPGQIPIPPTENHYSVIRRTEAYLEFCRERGLEPLAEGVEGACSPAEIVQAGLNAGITAFAAFNFNTAMTAECELRKRGRRVPEDVSIVCFDNPYLAAVVNPAMTCVEIPVEEMGLAAAKLLLEKYKVPGEYSGEKNVMFAGKLVVRNSAAFVSGIKDKLSTK